MTSVFTKLARACAAVGTASLAVAAAGQERLMPKNPNAPDLVAARDLNAGKLFSPPDVLLMTRIVARPGTIGQIRTLEAQRADALRRAGRARPFIGSASITGTPQLWILTRHDRIGEIADDLAAIDRDPALKAELDRIDAAEAPLVESKRDVTLKYQEEISYRPRFNWSAVRYWEIIWVHLKDGHHEAYEDNRKLTREEHDKGGFDTHQMMYAVKTGEQSGTFFVIRPMRTLGLLDELHAVDDGEPETAEEGKRKVADFADSVLSEQEAYFRVLDDVTTFK